MASKKRGAHSNRDWYNERLDALGAKARPTEADVSDVLVRPVLEEVLGFGFAEIDAQPSSGAGTGRIRRPDFICRRKGASRANLIVEVKKLGTNLTKRTSSASWASAPLGQLQDYLEKHRQSDDGTWGVVTNGIEWIVTRREGDHVVPFDRTSVVEVRSLAEIESALADVRKDKAPKAKRMASETDADWLSAAAECQSPQDFVERVTTLGSHTDIRKGHNSAHRLVAEHAVDGELLPVGVHVACLRMDFPDGQLSPLDISQALSDLSSVFGNRVVGIAYTDATGSGPRMCRGFIHDRDRLYATALIDPHLPGSRAVQQFTVLSARGTDESSSAVVGSLSSTPLHHRFHEEIAKWFKDTRGGRNELRHLIRVMFAWLLQARGVLPDSALWDQARRPSRKTEVHRHVNWLFTEVLATPKGLRDEVADAWKQSLIEEVPFLNGSLFSKLSKAEMPQPMDNEAYLGRKGLLAILSRYDWTLHDRTGYASESALDPTMLGDMYYTPQDVADEMAADAIAGWLFSKLPGIKWWEARCLVHSTPTAQPWRDWSAVDKRKAVRLLGSVTVLDPCCGSGVFTLAALYAIWRGRRRLSPRMSTQAELEVLQRIIERQLYAVDIHPMAVLITRLRLFIALIDARSRCVSPEEETAEPLPNLETRCIAANTLCIDLTSQDTFTSRQWHAGINELRAAREKWTEARYPEEKERALANEAKARERLRELVGTWSTEEDRAWLDIDFLSPAATTAQYDIRRLFPAPDEGWDIVIGNPPYQTPDATEKTRGRQLGYEGASSNLYLMFIEAVVNVVRKGGCVTLVVPHSIIFRRQAAFVNVRHMLEAAADRIETRTYDNMPQPLFPKLPWLKKSEHGVQNRQRATILSLYKRTRTGRSTADKVTVASNGLIRLNAANRNAILKHSRLGQPQPCLPGQWSQAPTADLAKLLRTMRLETPAPQTQTVPTKTVTFPPTAMYFISCLPEDALENYRRKPYRLANDRFYWPWLGLYNSHLFHAYWLMVGDAFDVTQQEYGTIRPPPGWEDEALRHEISRWARRLMHKKTLRDCHVVKANLGDQHNVNFHKEDSPGPTIISQLDRLLLDAYGLPHDRLIDQMHTIRAGSAHMLTRQHGS